MYHPSERLARDFENSSMFSDFFQKPKLIVRQSVRAHCPLVAVRPHFIHRKRQRTGDHILYGGIAIQIWWYHRRRLTQTVRKGRNYACYQIQCQSKNRFGSRWN
jgi:hypothetical protein